MNRASVQMRPSAIQSRFPPCLVESGAPLLPCSGGAVAARTLPSRPHWVPGSLKPGPPPLSLRALCRCAYFCDLHVAEIFVEPNYFYTRAFHMASVLRSVSFGRRLGETFHTEE